MQKSSPTDAIRPRGLETLIELALACWIMAVAATVFALFERSFFRQDASWLIEFAYLGCLVAGAAFWFSPLVLVAANLAFPFVTRTAVQSLDGFLLLVFGLGAVGFAMAGWLLGLVTRNWLLSWLEARFSSRQIAAGCGASLLLAPLFQFLSMGILGL